MEMRAMKDFPGFELVAAGRADLAAGRDTPEASALRMASGRLAGIGIEIPAADSASPASHHLYDLLSQVDQDAAHGRFNAISRRLVSFLHAAERAQAR